MVSDSTLNILAKAVGVVDASRNSTHALRLVSDEEFVADRDKIMEFVDKLTDQFWLANVSLAIQGGLTVDEIKLLVDEIRKGGQT